MKVRRNPAVVVPDDKGGFRTLPETYVLECTRTELVTIEESLAVVVSDYEGTVRDIKLVDRARKLRDTMRRVR